MLVQEGMVKDLRVRLYAHLLRLDLSVMQRTRGGQLAAALVSDADQVKMIVVAVLAALFQNAVMVVATLVADARHLAAPHPDGARAGADPDPRRAGAGGAGSSATPTPSPTSAAN